MRITNILTKNNDLIVVQQTRYNTINWGFFNRFHGIEHIKGELDVGCWHVKYKKE